MVAALCASLALGLPAAPQSLSIQPVAELAQRVLGTQSSQIQWELSDAKGEEWYEVTSRNGKPLIRASGPLALSSGLNEYIRSVLGGDISWGAGRQVRVPRTLPLPKTAIRQNAIVPFRYAYNFCTLSYTAAWWDWSKWEKEIDTLALSGVNHALVIQGMESAYFDAFQAEGYSQEEIRKWLVFPSHQPWQWMSNIEGFSRPVPIQVIEQRAELGRKISARMRSLGITPVLPGYYGIVPSDFAARHPETNVFPQGTWVSNDLRRPDMLDPTSSKFAEIASRYYKAIQKIAGPTSAFAADPFHEGGSTKDINLPAAGEAIYGAMARATPHPLWLLQSWGANPRLEMLSRLNPERVMILDLACERNENWRARKAFGGYPWAWCTISNFGGNSGVSGRLEWTAKAPVQAMASSDRGQLSGIAAAPEGIQNNPALWSLLWSHAWETNPAPDTQVWLVQYLSRRYGGSWSELTSIADQLLNSCYGNQPGSSEMPVNSVVAALPSLDDFPRARTWGSTEPAYDHSVLRKVWLKLLSAPSNLQKSEGYTFDVVDWGLMVLGAEATDTCTMLLAAYRSKDHQKFEMNAERIMLIIDQMDRLAGTHPTFMLGTWLGDARKWGATKSEKDDCDWAARTLLTTWYPGKSSLSDYSNRLWSGLLRDVYRPRWERWIETLRSSMQSGAAVNVGKARSDALDATLAWNQLNNRYPTRPSGNPVSISREIVKQLGF